MGSTNCNECGELFTFDVMPRRGAVCFRCHIQGIRLGFTHGKEDFHGPTIRERQREMVESNAKVGNKIEPVGKRWV
jgi:hypothetical protein